MHFVNILVLLLKDLQCLQQWQVYKPNKLPISIVFFFIGNLELYFLLSSGFLNKNNSMLNNWLKEKKLTVI